MTERRKLSGKKKRAPRRRILLGMEMLKSNPTVNVPFDDRMRFIGLNNRAACEALHANTKKESADCSTDQSSPKFHSFLLRTVSSIATNLVSTELENFDRAIYESLKSIGMAVAADRAYIWENFYKDGRLHCRQICEWSEKAEPQQGKDFTVSMNYEHIPEWKRCVLQGITINGPINNMSRHEKEILSSQGIISILIIPIHYHGHAWGFIGFDDCRKSRTFSQENEHVLHSAGVLMVSAILRNNMTQRLIRAGNKLKANEKLLSAGNKVARVLLENNRDDFMHIVHQSLKTLGRCVGAERVSIWRDGVDENQCAGAYLLYAWGQDCHYNKEQKHIFLDYEKSFSNVEGMRTSMSISTKEIKNCPICDEALPSDGLCFMVPINIQGVYWGFVAYIYMKQHHLEDTEKEILYSGGMMIASAIIKNEVKQSLVEARETALASSRAKSEFLSRMSHEIRTPMNAIIGMTRLAQKSNDVEKIKKYLSSVDASSEQLLGLINDVLDMSKIDAGKLEIVKREFDMEKVIKNAFSVIQIKLYEKKIDFKMEIQPFFNSVVGDEFRLSQVLINLLGNAIKFTPEGGSIGIKARWQELSDDYINVSICVSDTGIGIAPEKLTKIFQSFEQGDGGVTRRYGGTGLGLAICKQLMHLMGGEIWAESQLDKGSDFFVQLDMDLGQTIRSQVNGYKDRKVLVVDANSWQLGYFKYIFGEMHIECHTASSVEQAMGMLNICDYRIVLLDWTLTDMNGAQTVLKIKDMPHSGRIVLTMTSAHWSEIENQHISGIGGFLIKPVTPSDVYNILENPNDSHEMMEELVAKMTDAGRQSDCDERCEGEWSGKCVLLVEDIAVNREIIMAILEETGLMIDKAENGKQAVKMFVANPLRYDLILMDIQMPEMDGLEATKRIRGSGMIGCNSVPIIAMTANAFKEDVELSLEAGMNGHLTKPIDVEQLMATLRENIVL